MKLLNTIILILMMSQHFSYSQELKLYNETNSPLVSSKLTSLAIDSSNSVWVGAFNKKLYKFNENWNVDSSIWNIADGRNSIDEISVSPNGTIWFGISDYYRCGLYSLNNGLWDYIDYEYGISFIKNIFVDNDSTIYYSLINTWGMGPGDDQIAIFSNDSIRTFSVPFVQNLVPINKDTLLVAIAVGVIKFFPDSINLFYEDSINTINPNGWKPTGITKFGEEIFIYGEKLSKYTNGSYIDYTNVDSVLSSDTSNITSLAMDRDNVLWIGTDKGKLIKNGKNIEVHKLSDYGIRDIEIDRYNNKWFISYEGCFVYNEDGIVAVEEKIETNPNNKPLVYSLNQNYPNPFNPTTKITYSIPRQSPVTLKIYNSLGEEVLSLVNKMQLPGNYEVQFNATDLASGVYFYQLRADQFIESRKLLFLK